VIDSGWAYRSLTPASARVEHFPVRAFYHQEHVIQGTVVPYDDRYLGPVCGGGFEEMLRHYSTSILPGQDVPRKAGYTHVVPHTTRSYQDFIGVAMFAAAGRVATNIYMDLSPGMRRWNESDREDQKSIDAQAWQMYATLGLDPERWKAGIVARTAAVLRIPYVWEAVEVLAWQLLETGGEYAIPAKQVRRIFRKAKEKCQ
jgi:hypothetical protein